MRSHVVVLVAPCRLGTSNTSSSRIRAACIAASRWCVVGGAIGGIVGADAHWDYFWIANVIWLGFVLWAVVGSVLRLVAYHRGL